MDIEHETVASWFNYVRSKRDDRFTECFWDTQLKSKAEIIDNMPNDLHGNYYIFGGWYGVLAHLVDDNFVSHEIITIDIDPECKKVGDTFFIRPYMRYVTADMSTYEYDDDDERYRSPSIVINTSTEHVDQRVYESWWDRIPKDTFYVVQGNDLDIPEHIRTFSSLDYFVEWNRCTNITYRSEIELTGPNNSKYNRYTVMGYKE